MTEREYYYLQQDLSNHWLRKKRELSGKREEGYEMAILAVKSLVKNFYERHKEEGK